MNAENCREFLHEELARRTSVNGRYSQRAFAQALGLSPGELSEILAEKRMRALRRLSLAKFSSALSRLTRASFENCLDIVLLLATTIGNLKTNLVKLHELDCSI